MTTMKRLCKTTLAALILTLCCTVCIACYASSVNKEDTKKVSITRNISYFSRVETYSPAEVKFVQGKTVSMRIVGSKKLVDNIEVKQTGETLVIKNKSNKAMFGSNMFGSNADRNVTIYISSPDLTAVNVTGSGDFSADGTIDTDNLEVTLSGAGDMKFGRLVCDKVDFTINGVGDIDAKYVETLSTRCIVNGTGDIDIDYLRADKADIMTRGTGDIDAKLFGCGTTNATVIGTGDITLEGNTKKLEQKKMGTGDINTSKLTTGH